MNIRIASLVLAAFALSGCVAVPAGYAPRSSVVVDVGHYPPPPFVVWSEPFPYAYAEPRPLFRGPFGAYREGGWGHEGYRQDGFHDRGRWAPARRSQEEWHGHGERYRR